MSIHARYSGNLRDIAFPEIFHLIAEQRESGILVLRRDRVEKAITFREGRPVRVDSSLGRESFLRACVARDRMAAMAAVGLADQALAEGKPPEQVAEAQRILSPSVVASLVQEIQLARFLEIFAWRQGEFFFEIDPAVGSEGGPFPARPPAGLLLEGVREHMDAGRVRGLYRRRMDMVPIVGPRADSDADGLVLRPTEQRIVRAMDGRATIEEIVGESTTSMKEALRLLYVLEVLGRVDVVDPLQAQPETARAEEFKEYTFEVLEFSRLIDRDHARILGGNYFAILGLARDADEETLRRTYYALAQKYRPEELYLKAATSVRRRADQIFERLSLAYDTLLDWMREGARGRREAARKAAADLVAREIEIARAEREFLRGRELLDLRNVAQAKEQFERAARLRDGEGEYAAYLARAVAQGGAPGSREQAIATLRRAVLADGNCVPAYRFLGELHEAAGDLEAATEFLKKALRLRPDSQGMRKALKHLERLAGGASAEGAKHEQQALEKRMQEFLDARVGGDPYRILGLAPGAPKEEVRRAYFRLAKEFHPDRLSSVGPSLAGHPLAEKIFQLINEAYELLTDDTRRTVFDRGQDVQRQEGQVRQAMERRVRDEWMRKGESAVREGNYAVAREQFAQLLAADPENGPAIAHAAFVDYMLEAAGRHTSLAPYEKRFEAAEALRRGADLVHVLWGRMYKREGNPAQAMAHFQKAVERNPNCVEALREIRLARMRQEDEKPAGRAGLDLVGGILGRLRREK